MKKAYEFVRCAVKIAPVLSKYMSQSPHSIVEQKTKRKIFWRIVPIIFALHLMSFLDNVNVSYANLTMSKDLHFTPIIFGLGSGLFFVGYLILQIPVTLVANRKSPKKWIGIMAIGWGIVAFMTSFIQTESQFYILRLLLGFGEAGLFPVMVVFISRWFDAKQRATIISILIAAAGTAEVIGGPISTQILTMHWLNLEGWRWLFIIEGLPAVIIGVIAYFYLKDRPSKAQWLNAEEQKWIEDKLEAEITEKSKKFNYSWKQAIRKREVIVLCISYILWLAGAYGLLFFLPTMISGLGKFSLSTVGYLVALAYGIGVIVMIITGKQSDRKSEKKMHIIIPMLIGIAALGLNILLYHDVSLYVITLVVAVIGIGAGFGVFWSLPNSFLSKTAAAISVGLIGTVGNIGGFIGPLITGYLKSSTGSFVMSNVFLITALLGVVFLISSLKKSSISLQLAAD